MAFVSSGGHDSNLSVYRTAAAERRKKTLNDFGGHLRNRPEARDDMAVWHWWYDHPQATPKNDDLPR